MLNVNFDVLKDSFYIFWGFLRKRDAFSSMLASLRPMQSHRYNFCVVDAKITFSFLANIVILKSTTSKLYRASARRALARKLETRERFQKRLQIKNLSYPKTGEVFPHTTRNAFTKTTVLFFSGKQIFVLLRFALRRI